MKKLHKILMIGLLLGISGIAISLAQQEVKPAATGQASGKADESMQMKQMTVTRLDGMVDVKRVGTDVWVPAEVGMKLALGDRIRTTLDSVVDLTFDDGGVMQLSEETNLTILDLSKKVEKSRFLYFFKRPVEAEKKQFYLKEGTITAHVQPLPNNRSKYTLQTPRGIAGVRGTIFKISSSEKSDNVDCSTGTVNYWKFPDPATEQKFEAAVQAYLKVCDETYAAAAGGTEGAAAGAAQTEAAADRAEGHAGAIGGQTQRVFEVSAAEYAKIVEGTATYAEQVNTIQEKPPTTSAIDGASAAITDKVTSIGCITPEAANTIQVFAVEEQKLPLNVTQPADQVAAIQNIVTEQTNPTAGTVVLGQADLQSMQTPQQAAQNVGGDPNHNFAPPPPPFDPSHTGPPPPPPPPPHHMP